MIAETRSAPPGPVNETTSSATEKLAGSTALLKWNVISLTGTPAGPSGVEFTTMTFSLGVSKASVTYVELASSPPSAPRPMPLLANACQMSSLLAPPVSTWSAWSSASRPSRNDGLTGMSLSESITSCSARLLPAFRPGVSGSYPPAMFSLKPYLPISSQLMSHNAEHQITPMSWTSVLLAMSPKVSGSMDMS